MNTNIKQCNTDVLEKQKQQLEYEIVHGENSDHFSVFDIEAGCRKTRTAEKALVELYKTGKRAIFVRQFDNDCRESMNNINDIAMEKIAFAYNNEDVTPIMAKALDISKIPILIITHQKYRVLMMDSSKRKRFSQGRHTLVIDEFLSTISTISLGEDDIATYKAVFSNDYVLLQAFEKAMSMPIDFLTTWNKEDNSRKFITITDKSPTKDFSKLVKLIKANMDDSILNEYKGIAIQNMDKYEYFNYNLLGQIPTVKVLCENIMKYKQLFVSMCLYADKKLYTTDKRYKYWFLDNNIMLDASGELQIAYSLNNEEFTLQKCEKVLDHSRWKIINIPVSTTTSSKGRILNFYEIVNKEIKKYKNDILVVGKKAEMSYIDVPEENKGYFGNITGSNKWYNKKNVAIIQTHNLSDVDYILKYLHYAKEYIDENFLLSSKCNGRAGKRIYSFTNPKLENIRVHWIASEIYQAIKRVNRNMLYDSEVLIFLNNAEIIELVKSQMKHCEVEVLSNISDQFVYEKSKQDDYVDNLKRNSYATKFISFLAEVQNGLHLDVLDCKNRIPKVKARGYLGIKTSGNFSNKVLNKSDVISYCSARGIKLDGQYISLPNSS